MAAVQLDSATDAPAPEPIMKRVVSLVMQQLTSAAPAETPVELPTDDEHSVKVNAEQQALVQLDDAPAVQIDATPADLSAWEIPPVEESTETSLPAWVIEPPTYEKAEVAEEAPRQMTMRQEAASILRDLALRPLEDGDDVDLWSEVRILREPHYRFDTDVPQPIVVRPQTCDDLDLWNDTAPLSRSPYGL